MEILFLGTGTSNGVPQLCCNCDVCSSTDTRDKRLRASVLLTIDDKNILIDCGPDFRQQMLLHQVTSLSAILLTHEKYPEPVSYQSCPDLLVSGNHLHEDDYLIKMPRPLRQNTFEDSSRL